MHSIKRTEWRFAFRALCVTVPLLSAVSNAGAADATYSDQVPDPSFDETRFGKEPSQRNWSLIVGAGAGYEPKYEGSSDYEVTPLPVVLFTYGDWLEIDPLGVTVTPFEHNGFSVSAKVGYEMGRDEGDHDRLKGLGDIDFAATVGGKLAYKWQGLEIYAAVDQTIDGSESLIGTFGAEYMAPVTERLFLGAEAKATVANDKHMQAYFGVTPQQSAASGLPEYKAEAGLKRVDVSASAMYMLTENWLVRGEAGVGFLTGDAADSPIVEKKFQPSASIFVGYKF
ncbi:MipA/OmpV family protein [Agrobacterium tumefaciens]|uniref:MipA/OmpV family protein n=1 Tax=Agrobacterium tumefaciens TaxID=358 RepID=UPI001574924E|nr:MipA/OmpV family protein [Agrobacterium tumefaciens]